MRTPENAPVASLLDPSSARHRWLIAGIVALAFLLRLVPVLLGAGLHGVHEYDDGVYFSAALALVHGLVPYRDFLLLHPPGILLLNAPFAALSDAVGDPNAFAAARLGFMALGALNTWLVILVASRLGRRAGLLAGLLYAVWPIAVTMERTTWLIAPQSTLLLLALLALRFGGDSRAPVPGRRRAALAGVAMGLACSIQVWGVVPAAILLGWLVLRARHALGAWWRPAAAYVLAAVTAAFVVGAPFLIASGPRMVQYVLLDQVGRGKAHGSMVTRLRALEGFPIAAAHGVPLVPAIPVVLAFVVVAACIAWAAWTRAGMRPLTFLALAQVCGVAIAPPFGHYAGWVAPVGAVVIAGAVDTLLARRGAGSGFRLAVGVTYAAAIGALLVVSSVRDVGTRLDVPRLQQATAGARCVTADSPVLLVELDRLSRDVRAGCPLLLDPSGTSFDVDRGSRVTRIHRPEYQAAMAAYYRSGDAALFGRLGFDALSSATKASIWERFPVRTEVGPVTVLGTR